MPQDEPYRPANCSVAYQLNWTRAVFGKSKLPSPEPVLNALQIALKEDHLRILEYRKLESNVVQFFLSSQPQLSPCAIVRLIKGRWQYISRASDPIEFRRNFRITSCGSAKSSVLDQYVARQNSRHPVADANLQSMLEGLQFHDPLVEPARIQRSGHGEFVNALHLVVEMEQPELGVNVLGDYRRRIVDTCQKYGWQLSRIGVLTNHMHVLLAAGIQDSPESVAMKVLNNLAYMQDMRPVFKFGYYVGTFGEFDRGAIWNSLKQQDSGRGILEAREEFAVGY